jgi:hypothetical protein
MRTNYTHVPELVLKDEGETWIFKEVWEKTVRMALAQGTSRAHRHLLDFSFPFQVEKWLNTSCPCSA